MSRVTVTNPYDLLTDENEDRTNVPVAPKKEQKPAAPAAKPAAAKPAAAKPAAAKPAAAKPAAPKAEGAKATKPADKAAPKGNANQTVRPAAPRDSNQNLQERDKESRAPRDKRDHRVLPAGASANKKRPFDRKSGTGRPANENKKGGQGKANWGGEKEEVEALKEKEEKVEEEKEGETKEGETPAAEGEKKEGESKDEPPKDNTLTLDEYLAQRKTKAPVVAALQPRTVNAEEFGAAGLVPLQRGEEPEAPLNPKKKVAAAAAPAAKEEKPTGEKKEKTNLAAQLLTFASHQEEKSRERRSFRSYDNNRQGGERRPPRNNNNNRGPRNDNKGAAASQLPTSEKDFPSLSGDAVKA